MSSAGRLHSAARISARALADLFLPMACVACRGHAGAGAREVVCGRCIARLRPLPYPRCERCGHPRAAEGNCRWCDLLPPFVRAARSVCWFPHGTSGPIVEALKYGGWIAVAEPMAERMCRLEFPRDVVVERSALVPIPLAPARLRERGFNQSELLARALSRRWGTETLAGALLRTRATRTQTRLTPGERLTNVAGAFRAQETARARLRGSHIVLVDDVVTTSATLNAAATALYEAGARIVSYVTFGRAPAGGDRT